MRPVGPERAGIYGPVVVAMAMLAVFATLGQIEGTMIPLIFMGNWSH